MTHDPALPRPTFRPRGLILMHRIVKTKRKTNSRAPMPVATACYWCGGGFEGPCYRTREHLTPLSAGGSNKAENIAAACAPCNHSRGSTPHDEWADAIDEAMTRWPTLEQHLIGPVARELVRGR